MNLLLITIALLLPAHASAESLATQLSERSAASSAKLPEDAKKVMTASNTRLAASDILTHAPEIGSTLPDGTFFLPDGSRTSLYQVIADEAAIVTFYRGGWCPYCNIQLLSYQKHIPEIRAAGGNLIAISPELPDRSTATVQKNSLDFVVLSDKDNSYARSIGIVFELDTSLQEVYKQFGIDLKNNQGNDAWELPLAATFVVDSSHTIHYAFLDTDYKKRAEPKDLIAALRGLQRK